MTEGSTRALHYLDFAATSAVRPEAVARAVADFITGCGATPGRGEYGLAVDAGRLALRCRHALQEILGAPGDPGRIVFTLNATHAMNTALWGVVRERDVVVTTQYDHNAALRPTARLVAQRGVEQRMVSGAPDGAVDLEEAERLLDGARLLVINAASNVLGTLLPIAQLAALAREAGALTLVDAAQSVGHHPLRVATLDVDLIAFSGHKGLLGPQGIGGLWVRADLDLDPWMAGGTGGDSLERDMPSELPDRLEAGTMNAPGIAGLLAGCLHVLDRTPAELHRREVTLKARLLDGLSEISGVTIRSPRDLGGTGIVTITSAVLDPGTLAVRLDREWGVQVRSGLHCAPEVHRLLGTAETGAVRFSVGWSSTESDVDRAIEGVHALVGAPVISVLGQNTLDTIA